MSTCCPLRCRALTGRPRPLLLALQARQACTPSGWVGGGCGSVPDSLADAQPVTFSLLLVLLTFPAFIPPSLLPRSPSVD